MSVSMLVAKNNMLVGSYRLDLFFCRYQEWQYFQTGSRRTGERSSDSVSTLA